MALRINEPRRLHPEQAGKGGSLAWRSTVLGLGRPRFCSQLCCWVTLAKSRPFSVPQFPHLCNGGNATDLLCKALRTAGKVLLGTRLAGMNGAWV